jgi:hypothetical protein
LLLDQLLGALRERREASARIKRRDSVSRLIVVENRRCGGCKIGE